MEVQCATIMQEKTALISEIKRVKAIATEMVATHQSVEDNKIEEYVKKVLRLNKIDFAIRYSLKLMTALTTAKEDARLKKELEY